MRGEGGEQQAGEEVEWREKRERGREEPASGSGGRKGERRREGSWHSQAVERERDGEGQGERETSRKLRAQPSGLAEARGRPQC